MDKLEAMHHDETIACMETPTMQAMKILQVKYYELLSMLDATTQDEAENKILQLRSSARRARQALLNLEWIVVRDRYTEVMEWCPWCLSGKDNGHSNECERQIALECIKLTEGEGNG